MSIKERIDNWLKEILKNEEYNLGRKGSLTIYSEDKPFCVINIFSPSVPPDHPTYLEKAHNEASTLNSVYFITWNLRDTILWRRSKQGISVSRECRLKNYFTIQQISTVHNPVINPSIEILLKQRVGEIVQDLKTLSEVGHLYAVDIDASFFVHRLHQAVEKMSPLLKKSLSTQLYLRPQFTKDIYTWAVKQGIANYEEEEFLEALSRQIVYRLLGKIIFYESLRRHLKDLPEPDFSFLEPSFILKKLAECFEKARHIDYQAIFEEEIVDRASYSEDALLELQSLLEDLHKYNFSMMPQDVIGNVFERLIPYEERHTLGQYFTREDLVDFISAFCIRRMNDFILDPTCGTGTFLIRGYDRLKFLGKRDHKKLLQRLWGIDIARFPAQLATINLYRQRIENFENFPRVISKDFFEVTDDTVFQFPPPRANFKREEFIKEPMPKFNCIVGNFPYIRQELIEKRVKGYKRFLEKVLAKNWLIIYPDVFELKEKHKIEDYLRNNVNIVPLTEKVKLKLSGHADIYAYLFFHCGHFLKEGGRMGIVTSNAWLDVAYGCELQKFFLKNFKVIAIVESRCEPWFEDAAVNTVFTILEKCSNEGERQNHLVKFVKLKKKLKELIPWDMKLSNQRWQGINKLVERIEGTGSDLYKLEKTKFVYTLKGHKTYEDDDFRIRVLGQGELLEELEREGRTVKWGKYLRVPEVWYEILQSTAVPLVPLEPNLAKVRRGETTNNVKFFLPLKTDIGKWRIEQEFLISPIVYTPKEVPNIRMDKKKLRHVMFYCPMEKRGLKGTEAMKYIEWAESNNLGIKNEDKWYSLKRPDSSACCLHYARQDKNYRIIYNPDGVFVNDNLYRIIPRNKLDLELLCAVLNSTLFYLSIEISGRINLGDGALKVQVYELGKALVPDIRRISKNEKNSILTLLDRLRCRKTESIYQEIKMKDRQELDSAILEALELDPKVYLPKIYEGISELVRERLELPKMRKRTNKIKGKRDIDRLKEDVIKEMLPDGVKKFPEDSWDIGIKKDTFKEINFPDEPLNFSQPFFGEVEISTESGFSYKTKNPAEAKYIKYARFNNIFQIKIPQQPINVLRTVTAYERYIRDLKNKLFESLYNRTHDQKLSHSLVQSSLEELKIPEIGK